MATTNPADLIFGKLFDAVDTNHDNYVEYADYQRIIDRYTAGYKLTGSDRRAQALKAAYLTHWQELTRSANGSQRLDKKAFVAAYRQATTDPSRFTMIEGLVHAIFDLMDADGANEIGKEEFAKYVKLSGSAMPDAMEKFSAMDTDGDGMVSRQEYVRAAREFLLAGDANAPGGTIFGLV
ncbi:calcium-binding protein [Microtetraspora sp. NBRC 13810]|uniref:EF-hand domain-containing protein n=1 Tax=Microtetraspora sp. NBRC 13810 TaxID=3030990 RepID=UPI0024A55FDC|nr:EF-hand domain-containing protein [Microtetraspora sp. NBRC 13810]GLW08099.1 calcium-binding protein [Microtetraspora sp. NBRC 13810]